MNESGTTGAGEPRSLEFLEFIDTSSVLMDVAQLGTPCSLVEPGVRHSGNSHVDATSNDPRQHGEGRGEVIPSFHGTDFRQYERRVRLFVSNTRVAPERRAGKFLERLEGRASICVKGSKTWKHTMVLRICLIT